MIARLIEKSARNPLLVALGVAALLLAGAWAVKTMPLDAIPDLSDTQVVVYAKWMKSPDLLEDQVAYPLVRALLGAPKVKSIRAFSDFGSSWIYVIFEDGTDVYWARSRVLEYLSKVQGSLPEGVKVELGPDASGVGWVYQYALVDKSGKRGISELKALQDFNLKYVLTGVPGVSEVASVGGQTRQYQVEVSPPALQAFGLSFEDVARAVRASNRDAGGRLIEVGGAEAMIRGLGYLKDPGDLERTVVGRDRQGVPVLVRDVAKVALGPALRRGVTDLDGLGEAVGGIVTMRYGENALTVIDRVKAKLEEIKPSLPPGVEVVTVYDRSELIKASVSTLTSELGKIALAVGIVCLVFLWHLPSTFVILLTLPVALLASFILMRYFGVNANIMSLAGIAIAIGDMVDASIVMTENAHKKLEVWVKEGRKASRFDVIVKAAQEVGPSLFGSLLVLSIAFLPVFALQGQEGRLFTPLAWTKTLALLFSAFVAVVLTPLLLTLFLRGPLSPEDRNPVSRALHAAYGPAARWVLDHPRRTVAAAALLVILTFVPFSRLGREFMPPLWEGDLLYMPTTFPGLSVTEASRVLQSQDKVLKAFPEVERVYGKAGRAETSLDPAPFSMVETTILLKDEREWRKGMTKDKLLKQLDAALQVPGFSNAWTMPIKARLDMLSTGVRTPVGVKVLGEDLAVLERVGLEVERVLKEVPGTRSAFAERTVGGLYLDVKPRRDEAARYGMTVDDVQAFLEGAIGGEEVTTTVSGRARYGVSVRFDRESREGIERLRRLPLKTPSGSYVPLGQLADLSMVHGPAMLRSENGLLAAYVYADFEGRDVGRYVEDARRAVREKVALPPGVTLLWSGQWESMVRAGQRFALLIPLTLFLVFLLLYFTTKSLTETFLVLLAVPFSLVGAVWLVWALDYNLSVAVVVGFIALAGLDAETGVVMLLYLKMAYEKAKEGGRKLGIPGLREAVLEGSVKRLRPKLMTVAVNFVGLLPVMFDTGIGSDVMKRIAAPMVGGVATSFLLELLVYPALFFLWKWNTEVRPQEEGVEPRGWWKWIGKMG